MSKATKHNTGKVILAEPFKSKMFGLLATVLTFGAKKYARGNWRQGFKSEELLDALLGHLYSHYYLGELIDEESGIPHLGCAAAELMFLIEQDVEGTFSRTYFIDKEASNE